MKIEKLKRLPSGKYKILFDNDEKLITYDDVILKNNLLFNKEVDDEKLEEINLDTAYYNIYNKVLSYILKRKRSIKEIKEYIKKFNLEKKEENEIVEVFIYNGLLNDRSFASSYISDKMYLSNLGPNKIKEELLNHDISSEIIEEEINKIPNEIIEEKLKKIIMKKINTNHNKSNYMLKQKLLYELSDNGYDKELIIYLFDNLSNNDTSIAKKEYNKIYDKLSKKYSGSELNSKVRQKMYQKGFSFDIINELEKE